MKTVAHNIGRPIGRPIVGDGIFKQESKTRIAENNDRRITESGDVRVTEGE